MMGAAPRQIRRQQSELLTPFRISSVYNYQKWRTLTVLAARGGPSLSLKIQHTQAAMCLTSFLQAGAKEPFMLVRADSGTVSFQEQLHIQTVSTRKGLVHNCLFGPSESTRKPVQFIAGMCNNYHISKKSNSLFHTC